MTTDTAGTSGTNAGHIATIQEGAQLVTLVNVFTVAPEKQQQVVDMLIEATDKTMRNMPGFISANIHRSLDGKKVINYAQWRSKDAFEAMQKNPESGVHMKTIAAMTSFEPTLCEVVSVTSA